MSLPVNCIELLKYIIDTNAIIGIKHYKHNIKSYYASNHIMHPMYIIHLPRCLSEYI